MQRVAERILPGGAVDEVIEHLDHDPTRTIDGVDEFQAWNQGLIDRTIEEMGGTYFDIAAAVATVRGDDRAAGRRRRDVLHGAERRLLAARPHVVPDEGATTFPLWKEVSTCYHEGVPGHHLQVAQVKYLVREALALSTRVRVRVGPRRRLGAVRGAVDG